MNVKDLEEIEKLSRELIGLKKMSQTQRKMKVDNPVNPGNAFEVEIPEKDFKMLDKRIKEKAGIIKGLIKGL